ncbi:MAG: hypothetical protein MUO77_20760 [Anaerolineales bacterium]|nr:hypothetical protein [Anaerolineales bacterium]
MTERKKRTYQSDLLGLPPLRMVFVHAENDRRNAALKPTQKPKAVMLRSEQETVLKLIEHLKKQQ